MLTEIQLEQALTHDPNNADLLRNLGNARRAAGDLEGALANFRRALAIAPGNAAALYNAGLVLRQLNRFEEAEACFRRVSESDPSDAEALLHLGELVFGRSDFAEAERIYRAALRLQPENAFLWMRLGAACHEGSGNLEESVRCLRHCLALDPALSEAHRMLGSSCRKLGLTDAAAEAYRNAIHLEPDVAELHFELGSVLQNAGQTKEATEHYRAAIRLAPESAEPWVNLGAAQLGLGNWDEAIACLCKALQLQPQSVHAHFNLAFAYSMRDERKLAIEHYDAALRLKPGDAAAAGGLLFQMQHACDWSRFDEICEIRRRNLAAGSDIQGTPFSLLSIPSSPLEQLRNARHYAHDQARALARDRARLDFRFARASRPRIRVGYLSGDFREHPIAYLAAELFELHDREAFEIIAYSHGRDDSSPMRARLVSAFDRFVNVDGMCDAEAATTIHRDGVDILVDLMGYTTYARTGILALRPAPVQVNYLGYPGTMGADFVDYLVADRIVVPTDDARYYSEKIVWMPHSYQVNDRARPIAGRQARAELGLPEGAFVFCCFNQTYKILPVAFDVWMSLLKAVPGSVLWLLECNALAERNLLRETAARGIDPSRLIFAAKEPLARHLARLQAADLFLDTFPYNAHTTASDALWAGLPVITWAGNTFASRVAASLLNAVGLPELACGSMDEYATLALRLATAPRELAALRDKLWRNRPTAPLFDTPAFTRDIEAAYRTMWQNYIEGNPPVEIRL